MDLNRRAIKAGINVGICMAVAELLKVPYPFFLVLPSAVFMSSFGHSTLKAARNRIIGTFVGAAVGLILSYIAPENPIITGIGAIIIVYITNFLNFEAAATMGGLVFVSIMLGVKGQSPLMYSLNRFFYTVIGVIITVIVNIFVFRNDYINVLVRGTAKTEKDLSEALSSSICSKKNINIEPIHSRIQALKAHLNSYSKYLSIGRDISVKVKAYGSAVESLEAVYIHLRIIHGIDTPCSVSEQNNILSKRLLDCNCTGTNYTSDEISTVFNYHLHMALQSLEDVRRLING